MIEQFFDRLQMARLLRQAGMTKQVGVSARQLLRFLLGLMFTQRNFYRLLRNPDLDTLKKDAVYRFLASPRFNWRHLLLRTSLTITQ